jgi:hypothetical protein
VRAAVKPTRISARNTVWLGEVDVRGLVHGDTLAVQDQRLREVTHDDARLVGACAEVGRDAVGEDHRDTEQRAAGRAGACDSGSAARWSRRQRRHGP